MAEDLYGTFQRSSLAEEICARLLTLIRQRKLLPGAKLPAERELAAMMGVSRASLREALRALAIMRVLDIRQGDGTYVTSAEPLQIVENLSFVFPLDDATFLEMFEARKAIESYTAALAARRATERDIQDLQQCLRVVTESVDDPERYLVADRQLHEKINEIAGNRILDRFTASLGRLSQASRYRTYEIQGLAQRALEQLRRLVAAIEMRDPEQARQAMLAHLETLGASLQAHAAKNAQG